MDFSWFIVFRVQIVKESYQSEKAPNDRFALLGLIRGVHCLGALLEIKPITASDMHNWSATHVTEEWGTIADRRGLKSNPMMKSTTKQ